MLNTKTILGCAALASTLFIQGCANMDLLKAPQPNKEVRSEFNRTAVFKSADGKGGTTAMSFISHTAVENNNAKEARQNLRLEGMNLCWQQSAGRFFVEDDEYVMIENETGVKYLVWKIVCDPNKYLAQKVDNRKVFSPVYLINNRRETLDGR